MKKRIWFPAAALVVAGVFWVGVRPYLVRKYGQDFWYVSGVLLKKRLGLMAEEEPRPARQVPSGVAEAATMAISLDDSIAPFTDIGSTLGPRAQFNNVYIGSGVVLFDANGDGRLDMYLLHNGRPRTKQTDGNGVLSDELSRAKPCTLFLNMGNDAAGRPIFASVQDLEARGNARLLEEELLIENKYRPRKSLDDDEFAPGRIARGAAAADFNGDGRLDLIVANGHDGLPYQTHEFGLKVYPSRDNIGRESRSTSNYPVLRTFSFVRGEMVDGLTRTVSLGPEPEPEGRNSLYLNLGDADEDGIPEWKDVTVEAGLTGHFDSMSITVADVDRDGDLDFYVSNFLDPDFWGFGTTSFAGNRNELYINQLSETGKLTFKESAREWGAAGLHDEEGLPATVRFPGRAEDVAIGEALVDGKKVGEKADHSWAAQLADWNDDGWPDLVVANDEGNRLRVYENEGGKRFERLTSFDSPKWDGCWMAVSSGDLDGDGHDDVFVSNCGGQTMTAANTAVLIENEVEKPAIHALAVLGFMKGETTLHNAVLSYRPGRGLVDVTREVLVKHSPYIPPELTRRGNFAPKAAHLFDQEGYARGLAAYEFAWGAPLLDVDNDGRLDIYMAGGLARGNDGFLGETLGSPGRLLMNESQPGRLAFADKTLEYRVLDITDMDYDHNPPRRRSPGTGWHKRDFISVEDVDAYMEAGLGAAESSRTQDLFRMHEAATGITAGDLNGDGYPDIAVTHMGGYDSNSPKAKNLKVDVAGRVLAIPAPNPIYRAPTNFEEGGTSVYINGGARKGTDPNWVKIRLADRTSRNSQGIGAKVVLNGTVLRRVLLGGTTWSASTEDLGAGLGMEPLRTLDVTWPSGDLRPQHIKLKRPVTRELVCVDREIGVVACGRPLPPKGVVVTSRGTRP